MPGSYQCREPKPQPGSGPPTSTISCGVSEAAPKFVEEAVRAHAELL